MFEIPEIDVTDFQRDKSKYILVDVREPHELAGPEGQIEGVILAPMGSRFAHFISSADPEQRYVFICRSGHRSAQACTMAHTYGFHKVYNLKGGMVAWNQLLTKF
ncbi:MAG: rhodanese-like domain-containing protein [Alphaproteobacteria bacterium]|nr:rhodanese-like domain-containing protein [Alphaproteobacteria bacterium]